MYLQPVDGGDSSAASSSATATGTTTAVRYDHDDAADHVPGAGHYQPPRPAASRSPARTGDRALRLSPA